MQPDLPDNSQPSNVKETAETKAAPADDRPEIIITGLVRDNKKE